MYVQRFQQSLGASIPNLPGTVSNKDTWTHVSSIHLFQL